MLSQFARWATCDRYVFMGDECDCDFYRAADESWCNDVCGVGSKANPMGSRCCETVPLSGSRDIADPAASGYCWGGGMHSGSGYGERLGRTGCRGLWCP